MLARIKKLFGIGPAKPVDETAAAKAPLSHGEAAFKAQPSPTVPLTPPESAFKDRPATGPPLTHEEQAFKARPAAEPPLAKEEGE